MTGIRNKRAETVGCAISLAKSIILSMDKEGFEAYMKVCLDYLFSWQREMLGEHENLEKYLFEVHQINVIEDPERQQKLRATNVCWINWMMMELETGR